MDSDRKDRETEPRRCAPVDSIEAAARLQDARAFRFVARCVTGFYFFVTAWFLFNL